MMKQKLLIFTILLLTSFNIALLYADGTQPSGAGTPDDPYIVLTLDNLLWISTNNDSWDKNFLQSSDIDATETINWNSNEGFSPIGTDYTNKFSGTYNGNFHKIENLYINREFTDYIGFFGRIQSANISNLNLNRINFTGDDFVGGLVGYTDSNSEILNCNTTGTVNGYNNIGGITGFSYSNIFLCSSSCNISGTNGRVGGLIGWSDTNSITSDCFSTGSVSGSNLVGGLIGYSDTSEINNCYSTGYVNAGTFLGGLIGFNDESVVTNSFWDYTTSGQSTSEGGTAKTTAQMQDIATFTDLSTDGLDFPWDFVDNPNDDIGNEDYWAIDSQSNNGYPIFAVTSVGVQNNDTSGDINLPQITNLINYPNPFNPTTTISFSSKMNGVVSLSIFNSKGETISEFANMELKIGTNNFIFNAEYLHSGTYY